MTKYTPTAQTCSYNNDGIIELGASGGAGNFEYGVWLIEVLIKEFVLNLN